MIVEAGHMAATDGALERPTLRKALPSYGEYVAGTTVTERITALNGFEFTVFYQDNGALISEATRDAILAHGFGALNDLLESSGIHYLHELTAESQRLRRRSAELDERKPIVRFNLNHDTKQCSFDLYHDRFSITREPSSFEDFFKWYRSVMPEAARIAATMTRIVEKASNRPVRVVQSRYEFKLLFSDFESRARRTKPGPQRNVDVLEAFVKDLPDDKGRKRDISEQNFYRLDLQLSRPEVFGEPSSRKVRTVWYTVEAPFNENGRFIFFRVQLRNESTELLEPGAVDYQMVGFDPDFGEDYRLALIDFLKERALEGFAANLLDTWNFSTQRRP